MSTAARTAPSFDVTAPSDIMDFHSDSGLDFNDDDIDLELRSPSRFDDDVSLKDAATDAGLDMQTADQDDFMADHEDFIDEDIVTYDDAVPADELLMINGESEQRDATNAEEDLIDYSDDEEEPSAIDLVNVDAAKVDTTGSESKEQSVIPAPSFADEPTTHDESPHEHRHDVAEDDTQTWEDEASHLEGFQAVDDHHQYTGSHQEDDLNADDDTGSFAAQPEEDEPTTAPVKPQDHARSPEVSHSKPIDKDASDQTHQEAQHHPVTINYDGAELWLFKHHDYEDSGDYLVEESSLTDKPISSVIEACRAALGEDVSDDIELGFRLDNFHNIELFQDHSSCAFITLEHIVSVYLRLHAQDGVSDPESFYMTLLSRPRVYALLNTLNEAVEKGVGHVGLNKDIAAGLTSFNARLTHESMANEQRGNGEQISEHESYGSNSPDAVEEHKQEDQDEYEREAGDEVGHEPLEPQDVETAIQVEAHPQVESLANEDLAEIVKAETANDFLGTDDQVPQAVGDSASQAVVQQSPTHSARVSENPHDEDDLIDYSEDEADVKEPHGAQAQVNQPSSASSTVQGDNAPYAQDLADHEYAEIEGDATQGYDGGDGQDDLTQYDNFDEGFDGQAYGQDFENDDDTTNPNDESGDQVADQHIDLNAGVDDGNYDAAEDAINNDIFPGADAFLDFDNVDATADAFADDLVDGFADNDDITHDDEDGAVGRAPVAASAAADPLVTSSDEFSNMSPQGHKRTIDEVGNDLGDATDTSEAKRPRV